MNRKISIALLAAVLAVSCASPLLAGKRTHPSKLEYPKLELKTPDWFEIKLDNGLEGFLIEDHEIPVVNVVVLIKTYFPPRDRYGLSEMARWVIRNGGTEAWPSEKLNDELEFLAAYIEVYGGDLSTSMSFNCLTKDLPRVLGIYADLLMNPAFPEDKVEMKRKTMIEDIRRKNDQASEVARREYFKLVYGDHPYGMETSVASVSAITREDLAAFHGAYFHPNNAIIGISGDVTRDEMVRALNDALADWQRADVTIPKVPEIDGEPAASYNYAYKDINQAYMMIGHLGINDNNPDRCAIKIMNYILGGGSFTSWITEKVRSDKGLAYSTGSRFGSDAFAKGAFYAYAQTKLEEYSRAMQLIIEQIERMRNEGPTAEEVKKAIDSYLNSHVFDYESRAQVMQRLVTLRFEGQPLDSPERDMETYAALTVDDIKRVASEYLHPDKLTILVVGDEEKFDRPLNEFGEVNVIELEEE